MHEDTIATIREEEGHGLILAVSLWALWVCHGEMHLLSYLVQRGERLTTAVDTLAWCQCQHRIDATGIVRAALDE